ncbi:MAG: hypothetical protein ACRBN8_46230 [Nannocystales bacterium]
MAWLANYHNQVVSELREDWLTELGTLRSDLLCPSATTAHFGEAEAKKLLDEGESWFSDGTEHPS